MAVQRITLVVFATEMEAKSSILSLKAQRLTESLYSISQGLLLITGMGSYAAQSQIAQTLNKHPCKGIMSLGLAGSFQTHKLGDCLPIRSTTKHLIHPRQDNYSLSFAQKVFPPIEIQESGSKLLTSDFPIHWKEDHLLEYDVVDMEGYGIAWMANQLKLPCKLWRFVSDFTSREGPKTIQEQMAYLSEKMAHFLARNSD